MRAFLAIFGVMLIAYAVALWLGVPDGLALIVAGVETLAVLWAYDKITRDVW